MGQTEIDRLIGRVVRYGAFSAEGRRAIERLAAIGAPAIDGMRAILEHPPPTDLHPIDLSDSVLAFFAALARSMPGKLIELLPTWPDPVMLYWALGQADDRDSLVALIDGLRHKNLYVRWAAAESLVRRRDPRSVPALIGVLKDRSGLVRMTVVQAMETNRMYRRPEAIPLLERIVANRTVRKHSPGLWAKAGAILERIRNGGRSGRGIPDDRGI
jgi:hypothetical protein